MMDRYQRVKKPRLETPINENEIRITTQLLAEDPSLKQFKSHKKSVWRLKRVGDVLTIIVVAEVLEIAWFGTDSEVLEIAWSGILVQDAVGSTISWPTHFIRFDYE